MRDLVNLIVDIKKRFPNKGARSIVAEINAKYSKSNGFTGVTRYKVSKILRVLESEGEAHTRSLVWEEIFPTEESNIQRVYESNLILKLKKKESEYKGQMRHLQAENTFLKAELETLNNSYHFLKDLEDNYNPINFNKFSYNPVTSGENRAIPVLVASDWHVEEKVDPSTVNGLNKFNPKIAEERARNFFTNSIVLIKNFRSFHKIDTVVLAILGDMISGYIHEELVESNYLAPNQAILLVMGFIQEGIHRLKTELGIKKLIVPCCIGNHGRTEKSKKISTSYMNSFEWLMYKFLEKYYAEDEIVDFIIENSYHTYLYLFENKYKIRFHHGDSMRYLGGVGGMTIPVNKAIAQWNKIRQVDLDVFGHFHQLIDNGNWVCNGSLVGYGPYALSIKASYEEPRQAFFLVDEKRGKTIFTPIYVKTELSY